MLQNSVTFNKFYKSDNHLIACDNGPWIWQIRDPFTSTSEGELNIPNMTETRYPIRANAFYGTQIWFHVIILLIPSMVVPSPPSLCMWAPNKLDSLLPRLSKCLCGDYFAWKQHGLWSKSPGTDNRCWGEQRMSLSWCRYAHHCCQVRRNYSPAETNKHSVTQGQGK